MQGFDKTSIPKDIPRVICEDNVVNLCDSRFWTEDVSHARCDKVTVLSRMEHAGSIVLNIPRVRTALVEKNVKKLVLICARTHLHAVSVDNLQLADIFRLIGVNVMAHDFECASKLVEEAFLLADSLLKSEIDNMWDVKV